MSALTKTLVIVFSLCPLKLWPADRSSSAQTCAEQISSQLDTKPAFSFDSAGYPIMASDIHEDKLDGNFTSIPSAQLNANLQRIREATVDLHRELLKFDLSIHSSLTHTFKDVIVQIAAITWNLPPELTKLIAREVIILHLIDDWADRSDGKGVEFLTLHWTEPGLLPCLNGMSSHLGFAQMSTRFICSMEGSIKKTRPLNRKWIHFGIRRMLAGGPIFSQRTPPEDQFKFINSHRDQLAEALPKNSPLRIAIQTGVIHPFTLALSIKPVYEVIDVILERNFEAELSFLKSIFLGGLVYVHNDKIEKSAGESHRASHLSKNRLLRDLKIIKYMIRSLEPLSKRKFVRDIPPIIEAFACPLAANGLLEVYLEFLWEPEIREYIDPRLDLVAMSHKVAQIPCKFRGGF